MGFASDAYHGEDDGKVIPPERTDYPDPCVYAGEEDENDDSEEEPREGIDGDAPGALVVVRRHCRLLSRFRVSCLPNWIFSWRATTVAVWEQALPTPRPSVGSVLQAGMMRLNSRLLRRELLACLKSCAPRAF